MSILLFMLPSSCEQIYFVQILHYNWDHSFHVQQEQLGNPSINTKHPCPLVDNKALPNSLRVKFAGIVHITQLRLILWGIYICCWMLKDLARTFHLLWH